MVLIHCMKCRYHEEVKLDGSPSSRCRKENCLSMYSDCVANAAMQQFIDQNRITALDRAETALELCYPTM
ncbi:MAG TPA: hypothetical protein VMU60_09455 [Syntrophobacteria bacterium]|nr:hypothetical protein [Syntrophobacteria bacterium]